MNIYRVFLIYQNIESGGSTRYQAVYTVQAVDEVTALQEGIKQLGCNRDGELYSSTVTRLRIENSGR